jgi:Tfp pilus assembly protein PilF
MDKNDIPEPSTPPASAPRRRPFVLALLVVGATAGLWAAWVSWSRSRTGERSETSTPYRNAREGVRYVGDAACTRCHEAIAATYRKHPMGRSLSTIEQAPSDVRGEGAVRELFEAQGFRYAIERRGERTFHIETRRNAQGREIARVEGEVRYALGSGSRAFSFVVDHDGYLFESPVTWYAQSRRWDLSPGYAEKNFHFERPITPDCLNCHANKVLHVEGTDNRYRTPTFPGHAIGCERCHGPGELHVRQPFASPGEGPNIVNPRDLKPSLRENVCQQCHLMGVKNVERAGRSLADYRPGLPLHRFESVFVRPPGLARDHRNSGHVEQMHQSLCFRASRGEMGCISCHDPHEMPAPQEKAAYYRDRCLTCHADRGCSLPPATRLVKSPEDRCIDCHMPRAATSDIPHVATTLHSIPRRVEAEDPLSPSARPSRPDDTLLVLFHRNEMSPEEREETKRDLGMALCLMGKRGAAEALPLLGQAVATRPDDVRAWEGLGYSLAALDHYKEGLAAFESALSRAPNRETTLVGAAFFAEHLKERDQAVSYWRRAIAVDPWRSDYHTALAGQLFEGDQWTEAAEECRHALRLIPANHQARVVLIKCLLRSGAADKARAEFDTLLEFDPPDREGLIRWFQSQQTSPTTGEPG